MAEKESIHEKGNTEQQINIAARLQLLWLERMESMLTDEDDEGNSLMTSTDMATLARVLMHNGWRFDPNKLPQALRDKITANVAFDDELPEPAIAPIDR